MTEPSWAEAIRARTEQLIEDVADNLPENAGIVSIENALVEVEDAFFRDVAQEIVNASSTEKKVSGIG